MFVISEGSNLIDTILYAYGLSFRLRGEINPQAYLNIKVVLLNVDSATMTIAMT